MEQAAAEGKGAVSLDGRLIDAASIKMAENLVAKIEQIEARSEQRPPNCAAPASAAPGAASPGSGACRGELVADPRPEQRGVHADGDEAEAGGPLRSRASAPPPLQCMPATIPLAAQASRTRVIACSSASPPCPGLTPESE